MDGITELETLRRIDAGNKLLLIRRWLEELDSIPFVASETGLGVDEVEAWLKRLNRELRATVNARQVCIVCGEKYGPDENHDCPVMMDDAE